MSISLVFIPICVKRLLEGYVLWSVNLHVWLSRRAGRLLKPLEQREAHQVPCRVAIKETVEHGAVPVFDAHMNRTDTLKMCQVGARGQGTTMTRQSEIHKKFSTGVEPTIQKSPKIHRFERKTLKMG